MRYEIRAIADPSCTRLRDETLAATDDAAAAKALASEYADYVYGTGILDTQTGQIDWGFGFGVSVDEALGEDA